MGKCVVAKRGGNTLFWKKGRRRMEPFLLSLSHSHLSKKGGGGKEKLSKKEKDAFSFCSVRIAPGG